MVINIGFLKDGRHEEVEEIRQIHEACDGKILKVIIGNMSVNRRRKDQSSWWNFKVLMMQKNSLVLERAV